MPRHHRARPQDEPSGRSYDQAHRQSNDQRDPSALHAAVEAALACPAPPPAHSRSAQPRALEQGDSPR